MEKQEGSAGIESAGRYFKKILTEKKLSHAYILEGSDGPGRLRFARKIAERLLCEQGTGCGECASCRAIESGNHPDLLYVRHEKPDLIRIDEIRRQLVDDIGIRPYRSEYKIYIVEDADKMRQEAQNALLKTLEEPPSYGVIFLLASNGESFLPTILSRSIRLQLEEQGSVQERIPEEECLEILSFLGSAWESDRTEIVKTASAWKEKKYVFGDIAEIIRLWCRDVLIWKTTKSGRKFSFSAKQREVQRAGDRYSYPHIEKILLAVDQAEKRMAANVNAELVVSSLLAEMTAEAADRN